MAATYTKEQIDKAVQAAQQAVEKKYALERFSTFEDAYGHLAGAKGEIGTLGSEIWDFMHADAATLELCRKNAVNSVNPAVTVEEYVGHARDMAQAALRAANDGVPFGNQTGGIEGLKAWAILVNEGVLAFAQSLDMVLPPPDEAYIQQEIAYRRISHAPRNFGHDLRSDDDPFADEQTFNTAVRDILAKETDRLQRAAISAGSLGESQIETLRKDVVQWASEYSQLYDPNKFITAKEEKLSARADVNPVNRAFLNILREARKELKLPSVNQVAR